MSGCDAIFGLHDVSLPPDAPPPPGAWTQVAAGNTFTCAIDLDGGLWCWGYNGNGELGTNVSTSEVDVATRVSGGPWSTIVAGSAHACGLQRDDQSLWCWGSNFSGQLGKPGTATVRAPQQVAGQWTAIAARGDHTCASDAQGQLWCWGQDSNGQVGVGSTGDSFDKPQKVAITVPVRTIALGRSHTCVLTTDQNVTCWGANFSGQLGIGTSTPSTAPGAPVVGSWTELAAGDDFACGIDTGGNVQCWGDNSTNQLGDGGDVNSPSPHPIGTNDQDFAQIAAGSTQACAIHSDGTLVCWGDATPGFITTAAPNPVAVSGGANHWTALSLGRTHGCGIGKVNDLYCTGGGTSGELGNGSADAFSNQAPIQVDLTNVVDVGAGGDSTCALSNKLISCWGKNGQKQLGNGDVSRRLTPTPVMSSTEWISVSVGLTHACAIVSGPTSSYCWGYHGVGNAPTIVATPTAVMGAGTFTRVYAGGDHTCAITTAGNPMCWGSNPYGELGDGMTGPSEVTAPTATKPTIQFSALAAGGSFTCALAATQGVLYCAGSNDHGQLGLGTTAGSNMFLANTPVTGSGWTSVAAGYQHACAIKANVASCWGLNNFGQAIAPPGNTNLTTPTPALGTWTAVAPGKYHTCGIRLSDQGIGCWGRNDFGQLGDRSRTDAAKADVRLPAANFIKIVSGDNHSCALTDAGALWCWGDNHEGQLGAKAGWTADFVNISDPR